MIEFILGSIFGFGTFFVTLVLCTYLLQSNSKSYSDILTKLTKERFNEDDDDNQNK